ncbi:hypothetical protein B0H63DRAFT_231585 [Podospora didyma]|uniref:C2H2-type domain-containing protein n=1 Tax=Podospora didyma TaxID=330526 RepID=A0AAE0NCU4_9PEZI|nr:hypothetical protein B0H63DRAFT_231585 [Podospora didyma]
MSVRDKLAILWGNRPQEGAIEAEPPELFVGVVGTEDEEEHGAIITEPEVSVYTQTILGSQPYQWLIGSLLRESTFHWDETEPRVMVDGVRQTIVAELHTGIISPRREPDSHKVTFQITWSALKHRLQYERSFRGRTANGLRDVLSGSIALTSSSSHEIQATTVEQYLIQTWGPSGAEILRVLSEILPDPELTAPNLGVVDATSPGGPAGIRAEINERRDAVLVSVTGPACLVGERAEQLAWLVATLQCSPAHEWRSIHAKTSLLKMPSSGEGDTRWLLAPNNETEAHERALSLLSGWLGQLVCRVIARGFPTTRRPKLCPGIEIPAPMLQSFLKLAGMERTSTLNIGTIASGPSGTLKLVKREGRLFVWHMFQLRVSDACSCHEILRRATDPEDSTTWLSDGDMSQTRHILGDCESTRAWLAGMPPLEPPTSPRPTSTTWRESPSNTDAMSDASSTMRTAIHWKNEEGEREKKLFSPSAESSHETSIDSDMLSISATSTSSWTSLINEHEELSAVIAFVARRLYSEYRNTRFRTGATQDTNKRAHVCRSQSTIRGNTELSCLEHCFSRLRISDASEPRLEDCVKGNPSLVGEPQHGQPEAPSDSPGGSGTSSGSSGGAPLLPRATQQGKGKGRQTVGNGGDGDKDQDSYKPLSKKRARRERPDTTARVLACHFWKNDPEKHRCCFKSELNTVSRVKQHLWRKHTPEYYCERCKVILSDEQTHTLHLEQTPVCELNQDATLDGITHQQQRKLSRRSKKTLDESEQWFVIWDDLFPRQGRPSSPYMDADLSEDVYRYRRYVQRTGHEVLTEELRRRGILLSLQQEDTDADMAVREKAVREALRISLDLMLSDWLSSRSAGEASSASSELREPLPCPKRQKRPRSPRPPTPSDSFADSGIGMLNNPLVRDQRQNRNSNQKGNTECSEGEYLAESGEVQPPRRLDGENLAASSFSAGFFPDSFFDQDGLLDAPVEYNGVVDPAMVPSEGGQLPQSDPLDMGFLGFHSGADVDDSGNDPWS